MNFHPVVEYPLKIMLCFLQNVVCSNSIAPSAFTTWHFPVSILALFHYVLHKIDGMTFKNHKCDQIFQWLPASPQILLESAGIPHLFVRALHDRALPSSPAWAQATSPLPSTHRHLTEFKQYRPFLLKGLPTYPLARNPLPPASASFA